MNTKLQTSETGTNLKEKDQQTGTHSSECGSVDLKDLTVKQQMMMRTIPRFFLPLLNECMLLRIYELKFMNNRAEFNPHVDIDLEISHMIPHLHEVIRKPMYGEVAEQLTRLSNVLQCQLPNEEGLQEYFKILAEFPLVLLEECVEYIIQTARYRKLPLPIDFIAHMEVSRTVHVTWLDRLERLYINYKE